MIMNSYIKNDYSKVEKQIKEFKRVILTKHFKTRMLERAITFQDMLKIVGDPTIIRHEGSYDHYGDLKIKYTLQSKDRQEEDIAVVCSLASKGIVVLITVMYFWEEIGWVRQENGLYLKK